MVEVVNVVSDSDSDVDVGLFPHPYKPQDYTPHPPRGRRMECEWNGEHTTILFDLITGVVLDYADEEHREFLHHEYGGEKYHESREGLSGAGWVPTGLGLVRLGTYRADVTTWNFARFVTEPDYTIDGWRVYVPIANPDGGKAIQYNAPAVIVGATDEDGMEMVVTSVRNIQDFFTSSYEIGDAKEKTIGVPWVDSAMQARIFSLDICMLDFMRWSVFSYRPSLMFFGGAIPPREDLPLSPGQEEIVPGTRIFLTGHEYVHVRPENYIDQVWDRDPFGDSRIAEISGWRRAGSIFIRQAGGGFKRLDPAAGTVSDIPLAEAREIVAEAVENPPQPDDPIKNPRFDLSSGRVGPGTAAEMKTVLLQWAAHQEAVLEEKRKKKEE